MTNFSQKGGMKRYRLNNKSTILSQYNSKIIQRNIKILELDQNYLSKVMRTSVRGLYLHSRLKQNIALPFVSK